MKFLSRFIVMSLALGVVLPVQAAKDSNAAKPKPTRIVNRVAAVVNGRPITSSEVRSRLQPYVNELLMPYPQQGGRFNGELIKAKKAVLDELIERELVLSDFEGKGMQMPASAIDDEINRRILTHFNGKREALLDNLRKSGMTYSEYRDSVRKEVTVGAMRNMRYDRDIPPTPDEIRAEYQATKYDYRDMTKDSVRYKKIFIPMGASDDPNATPEEQFQFAQELTESIIKGEISFEDAAV
ncbi:MAG: SurA N-terminal domain-containing protein, partial [Akkermansia sp.]|nr:SurA N-terminal domain-containing protein [Akkermansia sp.]